jgi:triacylglycerol lipase
MKFSRRQILLGGFGIGAGLSITTSRLRNQKLELAINEGSDLAYEANLSLNQVHNLQQKVQLKEPIVPYNREMSKILVRCCRLATEQYLEGIKDANYQGAIASLPSYFPELNQYQQVATFGGIPKSRDFLEPILDKFQGHNFLPEKILNYAGFILKSNQKNILVIRGTQKPREWVANLNAKQTYYQSNNLKAGKIHKGFNHLYRQNLDKLILAEIKKLDLNIPLYITGHSLGGAVAILISLDLALNFETLRSNIRTYTYGSPRVGDPNFVQFYSELVPNTYRIVNQADSTWLLPPMQIKDTFYLHLGQNWSFVYQTQDLSLNHQLTVYQAAVDNEVETAEEINQPISSF